MTKYDEKTLAQIHKGRVNFMAMVATYGLGVFNDSFFRQSAIWLAIAAQREHMQGWIMSLFALPYLLFASPAGWLADRFAKRRIVIAAKVLEVIAMALGAIGICTLNWGFILAMVFTMALQSCMFSPALNGSIPELYPAAYVTKANATLKVIVTAMILAGVSISGVTLKAPGDGWFGVPMGRALVGFGAVAIAAFGLLISFGVPRRPAADPKAPFPWSGPISTAREFLRLRSDSLLGKVVAADVFIWFAGAMIIQFITTMAKRQFGWGEDIGGYLIGAQMVGIAIGGITISRLADGPRWYRILPLAVLAMAIPLLLMETVAFMPERFRLPTSFVLLGLAGICGGIVLVPSEAFVQVRPEAGRKGTVLASVNFGVFAGIMVSGPLANLVNAFLDPTRGLAMVGALAALFGLWLRRAMRKEND